MILKLNRVVALALAGLLASSSALATTYQYRIFSKGLLATAAQPAGPAPAAAWTVTGAMAFAATNVDSFAAADQTVSVKNTGTLSGTPSVSAFTGANASDFSISNNGCGGAVAINATCDVTVRFKPAAVGARTATLQVGTTSVNLSGTGTVFDPYFANVSLLMHMDGVDGGTAFMDVKNKSVTAVGGAVTSTTSSGKFGASSAWFNGSSAYLSIPASADFAFDGDFTLEAWVYVNSTGVDRTILSNRVTGGSGDWMLLVNPARSITWYYDSDATSISTPALSVNAWHHVAAVRAGTKLTVYADGAAGGSVTKSGAIGLSNAALRVGFLGGNPNWYYNGSVDEVRITKGVARYTANFTPPTAAFSDQ
jgi:hypothetical protein